MSMDTPEPAPVAAVEEKAADEPRRLSIHQVAGILGCSVFSIRRRMQEGIFPIPPANHRGVVTKPYFWWEPTVLKWKAENYSPESDITPPKPEPSEVDDAKSHSEG